MLNAANEMAVRAFLDANILLTDIADTVRGVMKEHIPKPAADIETILAADAEARVAAERLIGSRAAAAVTEFV